MGFISATSKLEASTALQGLTERQGWLISLETAAPYGLSLPHLQPTGLTLSRA
jgi:hypothetical protein